MKTKLKWITRANDKSNNPTKDGLYAIMVSGDSEYVDGHCIYSFGSYETFGSFTLDEDGGSFKGEHDEEDFTIFAYYGPIVIPPYKESI